MTILSIMVAMGRDRTIGKNNDLPWHLPNDLKYFRKMTMGHPIIMGRKTHESIGKALDGRLNIVVTRNERYEAANGCVVTHTVEDTLQVVEHEEEAFVIGGAEVIQMFLPHADRLYLTYIDEDFAGDVLLPVLADEEWRLVSTTPGIIDERNPHRHEFRVYERVQLQR